MAPFHNRAFRHWGLKFFSLLIAFLLWSTYRIEPVVEIAYQVPIEFHNIPQNLDISGDIPTQAHVRIRGRSAVLRRLTPVDLAVTVDVSGSGPGEKVIPLTTGQIDLPPGAELVRISPAEIHLRLEPRQVPRSPVVE